MMNRKFEEAVFKVLMWLSITIVVGTLLAIFGVIVWKGVSVLNLSMIIQTPQGGYYLGKEGGILNAIIGSIYLASGATALAFLFSITIIVYLHGYAAPNSRIANVSRLSFELLCGIPSIVYGAFILIIMLYLRVRASLLWGIITVALFEFPIMTRGIDEVMQRVPSKIIEAAYSLGSTRLETMMKVAVKQSLPGIVTVVLLAFGRGIGDAAAVLFTAGYTDSIPNSLLDPVATLPLAVFFQIGTPFPEVQQRAYASGIILLVIVLLISIASRVVTKKFMKYVIP